jgi:hypothetical protein
MEVDLNDATEQDLHLLASAWGISPGAAVTRLIAEFRAVSKVTSGSAERQAAPTPVIDIHVDYAGTRVAATFNPKTTAVRIVDGPLAGKTFPKPSSASRAVIGWLNPAQKSRSANGFEFWMVTATGKRLQTVRPTPPIRRRRD